MPPDKTCEVVEVLGLSGGSLLFGHVSKFVNLTL
jgi:hypothetical protein